MWFKVSDLLLENIINILSINFCFEHCARQRVTNSDICKVR